VKVDLFIKSFMKTYKDKEPKLGVVGKNDNSHSLKVEINLKHFNGANNTVYPNNLPHELQRQKINEGMGILGIFLQHYKPIQPVKAYLSHTQRFKNV
jgi:hypothetical protein